MALLEIVQRQILQKSSGQGKLRRGWTWHARSGVLSEKAFGSVSVWLNGNLLLNHLADCDVGLRNTWRANGMETSRQYKQNHVSLGI